MSVPLRLLAVEAADLDVISAAVQDGVFALKDAVWRPRARRFAVRLQRYRWETASDGASGERVEAVLAFESVLSVKAAKVALGRPEAVASILSVSMAPGSEPPGGAVEIALAGGGSIRLEVDCLDAALADIGTPRAAVRQPDHEI
jgi:hypothetical protein